MLIKFICCALCIELLSVRVCLVTLWSTKAGWQSQTHWRWTLANTRALRSTCHKSHLHLSNSPSNKYVSPTLLYLHKVPLEHTHPFNGPLSGTTQVGQYQKGKTNLDFTEARDSERQWHQLCHMQVCTSLRADNHASTPPLSFLQAGCPSCRPTNSVKVLKALRSCWKVVIIIDTGQFEQ